MASTSPQGVHFVGAFGMRDAEQVFRTVASVLPHHVKSITDGEIGPNRIFVGCQIDAFNHVPELLRSSISGLPESTERIPLDQVASRVGKLNLGYAKDATESYKLFRTLKDDGVIPKKVKFQFCLPTPCHGLVFLIAPAYQATLEPIYEAALIEDIRAIQDSIPHDDLVLQIDSGYENFAFEEGWKKENRYGWDNSYKPWFEPVKEGLMHRFARLVGNDHIDADVELGMHLCLGSLGGKHWGDAKDTEILVEVISQMLPRLGRHIDYVHLPVPKDRDDAGYLEPLKKVLPLLKHKVSHIYLGLVHPNDEEGTKRRIETAKSVFGNEISWGVSTECGTRQASPAELDSILTISRSQSSPWS